MPLKPIREVIKGFTRGPWKSDGRLVYAHGTGGGMICELSEPRSLYVQHTPLGLGSPDATEAYANGDLIAMAPILVDRVDVLEHTVLEAGAVLEALHASTKWEIAPALKEEIRRTVGLIRHALDMQVVERPSIETLPPTFPGYNLCSLCHGSHFTRDHDAVEALQPKP